MDEPQNEKQHRQHIEKLKRRFEDWLLNIQLRHGISLNDLKQALTEILEGN